MNDTTTRPDLPDRLSNNSRSRYFSEDVLENDIGIMLNDKERTNVEEYCISEGWIKVPSPKALDRRGQPLLMTFKGKVEAFYK
jgi:hypothetical protein